MKKLRKSKVCGSREQCTEPTNVQCAQKKSQQSRLKKKKKKRENANVGSTTQSVLVKILIKVQIPFSL